MADRVRGNVNESGERRMSERDEYIPGVPCWVDVSYKDPESVLPFYRGAVRLGVHPGYRDSG